MTEIEMTGLLIKLADHGVTGIKIHYDGSGDSGAIEEICYTTDPCASPSDVDDNVEIWGSSYSLSHLDEIAYKAIENFAHEKLLEDIEDWYNNEGGFGDISICVPSGKYMIDNHVRYYTTEDYQHEGSLIEKSAD
jgi:hypothetical protein